MHDRVSYKTVAISLLYLYSKSCMAIMQHRRTTVASMLQNGISRNTKCDIMVSFPKSSPIFPSFPVTVSLQHVVKPRVTKFDGYMAAINS